MMLMTHAATRLKILLLCALMTGLTALGSEIYANEAVLKTGDNPIIRTFSLASATSNNWHLPNGLPKGTELEVTGEVASETGRILVRIDHAASKSYYTRFNHEQILNSGKFVIHIDLDRLKTAHQHPFPASDIRQTYLSTLSGKITFLTAQIRVKPSAPKNIVGWDLGNQNTSNAWGFYALTPDSTWESLGGKSINKPEEPGEKIIEGTLRSRDRPYHDELTRDGLEGISKITLPLENGIWRIRLWTQDIGEWEYLPHPLNRTISLNKQRILHERLSPLEWQKRNYFPSPKYPLHAIKNALKESKTEALYQAFWRDIGSKRGSPVDAIVEVKNNFLLIEMNSDVPAGRFLSAIIATPWDNQAEARFNAFDRLRYDFFTQRWPIIIDNTALEISDNLNAVDWINDSPWLAEGELVTFKINFAHLPYDLGRLKKAELPLEDITWFIMTPMINRVGGQENALTLRSYLTSFDPLDGVTQAPSHSDVWYVTGKFKPNSQKQQATLFFTNGQTKQTFHSLDVSLPEAKLPIGLYMDYAPHLVWFSQEEAIKQANCDYRFMKKIGLTGTAPALPTPILTQTPTQAIEKVQSRLTDLKRAIQAPYIAGLLPPFPAYTPIKRMLTEPSFNQSRKSTGNLINTLTSIGSLNNLIMWSMADEPGLFPDLDAQLSTLNKRLSQSKTGIKTYAQLNHSQHDLLIDQYQSVLINQGYGLTESRLNDLTVKNTPYYLYNLPNLRASAGHYLWRSNAQGFWQWHARMPTAHPFDPTDGREDDVHFILPTLKGCERPTIRADLLSLRAGINDFRWLSWLSQNAKNHIDFAILQQEIRHKISLNYLNNNFKNKELNRNIKSIKQLAQSLQLN
ncbi:hypothetical protein [Marinomonas algicola]|uniref:hypothetical protein n=1 Tax=Marinomonas algicola TaxID=2773454 RepID=UPI00174E7A88|nr:hypothetical protein [Marinomonas algicola]